MSHKGILTDVTRCIGCASCVTACREANDTGSPVPTPWQPDVNELSATRWTTLDRLPGGRFVRRQCRHCLEPACASACPVGALQKAPDGAVIYDSARCMGCRYCMMACPFAIPRYSWDTAVPYVRKCVLCHDRIARGEATEPACTEACPVEATIFGDREALLAEAKRRIAEKPDLYVDRVWGEHEAGGTGILNISDVDIPLPATVPTDPLPERTMKVLRTVPAVFVGVGAAMVSLRWLIGRRDRLRAEAASGDGHTEAPATDEKENH
ncbi:MAG: 4Fe-4S dicluster domain-containing protein [Planctomycetes bacterium]|jgi:formate dehydrogenase iron-sulfur subunit|nr:4Fe-4S dicluster domain-containing protein [Planctomycetota bacterium]